MWLWILSALIIVLAWGAWFFLPAAAGIPMWVPLAITGHDVGTFFRDVLPMVEACGPNMPAMVNPGLGLGVVLGEA